MTWLVKYMNAFYLGGFRGIGQDINASQKWRCAHAQLAAGENWEMTNRLNLIKDD